jgi:hypothetical protein
MSLVFNIFVVSDRVCHRSVRCSLLYQSIIIPQVFLFLPCVLALNVRSQWPRGLTRRSSSLWRSARLFESHLRNYTLRPFLIYCASVLDGEVDPQVTFLTKRGSKIIDTGIVLIHEVPLQKYVGDRRPINAKLVTGPTHCWGIVLIRMWDWLWQKYSRRA